MKNGRPSLIYDIRYFLERGHYLNDHSITAFGRRMAWYLNGEGLSVGSFDSVYVCFSSTLELGSISVGEEAGDWWQRYIYVGVPNSFPNSAESSELAMQGTVAALKLLRPNAGDLIDAADRTVRRCTDKLRFLVRTKPFKHYVLQAATTIGAFPEPSLLYFSIMDRATGEIAELPPVGGGIYFQAFSETSGIGLSDIDVGISNEGNFYARWKKRVVAVSTENPILSGTAMAEFYSKQVRPR